MAGSFLLDRADPYVGVDTGMLNGKARIVEWRDGEEPLLQVEKRGCFITNIGFANFVTALETADAGISVKSWFYRQRLEATLQRDVRPWFLLVDSGCNDPWTGVAGNASVEPIDVSAKLRSLARRQQVSS